MHELMLEFVRDAPAHALARFPLDDGALVALFPSGGKPGTAAAAPRWIAKTAHTAAGCRRLRAEARALGQLEPWAATLGLPRLLGWSECAAASTDLAASADGEGAPQACLIQSGVAGCSPRPAGFWRDGGGVPPATALAADWLLRFQRLVPVSRPPASLAELTEWTRAQADDDGQQHPAWAALLGALAGCLAPGRLPPLGQHPTVAVHGDFWAGNVLLAPSRGRAAAAAPDLRLHVVDWSGFDAGTALEDFLNWMSHPQPGSGRKNSLESWIRTFFCPGRSREALRAWAARVGYDDATARAAFLLFLVRRLRWELGLGLQARNPAEIAQAHRDWSARLAWMAQHRFPDPFLPLAEE